MALITSMSTRGKITLAACALGFLAAVLFILKMAGAPSYTTVMTGVDPAKASQITAALSAAGIQSEIENGGTAIGVQKGKESAATVALAAKGLNSTATQPGFEILDKQKLGASSQQQQIAYQRGLEGTIANTIGQIQGAAGAQVHLTLPQDNLFSDESRPATAAVLIPGDSSAMEPSSVRGIANLVASSVPGLKPAQVTITDGAGTMVWPQGDGGGGGDGTLPSKTAAEARYDAQLEGSLNAMLAQTLGAGKAQVQVHSDLDVDKTDQQQLSYDKKGVALAEKKTVESLKGTGAGAAGAAGSQSNLPGYAANAATGGGNNDYKNTTTDTQFGVGKTVTKTTKAPGTVNNLQVAVLVDKNAKLQKPDIAALTATLSSAAGIQTARGDKLTISQVAFAGPPKATKPAGLPIPPAFAGLLKGLGIGMGALLFLFFVTRHLRRRERETLADEPSWLKALEAQRPHLQLPDMSAQPTMDISEVRVATADPRRQQLDNIIHDEPERVAAHLRQWITEDGR